MSKTGRPPKYNAEFHVPWAKTLARRGATNKEIAEEMQISEHTLYQWAREHEEFSQSLTEGREEADCRMENTLFERAMGLAKSVETRKIVERDKKGNPIPKRVETITKQALPDVNACLKWLKMRQPALWNEDYAQNSNERPIIIEDIK